MSVNAWILIASGIILFALFIYWQLSIAEGAYLGQRSVTWLYDITAHKYDGIKQYDASMEERFLGRPLAEALRGLPAPLVLDVATGTARLPVTILEQPNFQGRLIGVDHSLEMLKIASEKTIAFPSRIDFIWRDASQLPFPDDVFDCVACLEMLEFTPNPEGQLAEAVRILRPGGLLMTTRRRGLNAVLMPGKTHSTVAFETLLEYLGLTQVTVQRWQVEYDLVWAYKNGYSVPQAPHLTEILQCPECNTFDWVKSDTQLACNTCSAVYSMYDNIIDMHNR